MRKISFLRLSLLLWAAAMPQGTAACTGIYLGSACTADQKIYIGRSEDINVRDYPKLLTDREASYYKKGELYQGCYGFAYTFSHDSYAYSAFLDDQSGGHCPACGQSHPHSPYQAGGINEKGLTVTATVTLIGRAELVAADPFIEGGIEEAEIPTILLSEAATAREALSLLAGIYEKEGAGCGGGVLISDAQESWYIENLSGREYLAVRLNPDMVLFSPNLSVLGAIDLDDTEQVTASEGLIGTALKSGCFVGDEKENVIDFAASFEEPVLADSEMRLPVGLGFLTGHEELSPELFRVTNLDEAGEITALHSGIRLKEKADLQTVIDFYHLDQIAGPFNAETHIFQITPGEEDPLSTVGWVSFSNNRRSVFVPLLSSEKAELPLRCTAGAGWALRREEEPDEGLYFKEGDQFVCFPKGWENSAYWIFDALSRVCESNPEAEKQIDPALLSLQREVLYCFEAFWEDGGEGGAEKASPGQSQLPADLVYDRALALLEEVLSSGEKS